MVSNHGLPKEFITNRDKLFTSKFWETLTAELGVKHKMSTAYHPQTDGQSERMNQTVETYLRHYVNMKQSNWVQLLPMAQFTYNNARNETTGKTPFEANYGYHPEVWRDPRAHGSRSQRAILDIAELKKLHADLTKRIEGQKGRTTEVKPFEIGERVYLRTDNMRTKKKSKELMNKSIGPFMIKRNIKELSYELDLPQGMQIHPVFHASMLQRCNQSIPLQATPTPVEPENEYEVEEILGERIISGEAHYLVKWKGYDASESTWEPQDNLLNCARTLQQFEKGAQDPRKD